MRQKFVIVGNGIAAITAIKAIRETDKESEIHLFGEERFFPYNRIRLSKGLLTTLEEDKILLQRKDWYTANNVNLHLDIKVDSINIKDKEVKLTNGDKIAYSKLLLANGAKNRMPPIKGIDKNGVSTLRTLQDAWNVMDRVKHMDTILNIGGGIQGLETTWILSKHGKNVIIAELLPRLMPRQLDEKASKILEKVIRSHNIEVLLDIQLDEIFGKNKVEGFKTKEDKKFNCDGVLYSIGIKPNKDILKDSDIKTNKGIIVNEKMETNVLDVFAAGDIAEFNGQVYGLWNIAIGQGKIAGYNMVGRNMIYEHIVPVTTLNAFNLSLFSMGIVDDHLATDIMIEDKSSDNIYSKILIKDNKVIGAIIIGNIKSSPVLKSSIEKEKDLSEIDFKKLSINQLIKIIKEIK